MMRFCQAMCLFFDDDYEEVMRKLVGALKSMGSWRDDWKVPSTSAITQARQRLGADPLRVLFERAAVPVAGRGTKGAWLGSRRLMAIDGFMVDVPDTDENAAEFGRKGNGRKASAFPQVLAVVLGECGSHAITGAGLGPCHSDERALARQLVSRVEPDMLVTADRNFYSFAVWEEFRRTGADLLWRVNANLILPVIRWLPDGCHSCAPSASSAATSQGRRTFPLNTGKEHSPRPSPKSMNAGQKAERHRTNPRVIRRDRHNCYIVKKPHHHGTVHDDPPTIRLHAPRLT